MAAAENKIFRVETNDIYGRYLVANTDIKQGQLILKEKAAILCAQVGDPAICFKCCRRLGKAVFCPNCSTALLCNSKCNGDHHDTVECDLLKTNQIEGEVLLTNPEIISALRCLLLRQSNPDLFDKILKMEPHLEQRRNTEIWHRNQITVEKILEGIKIDIKDEIVQKICGILDVNCFQVRQPNNYTSTLRGLYLDAALMAHNCITNTHLAVDEDFVLYIHASVDIPEGNAIYFNYANALKGNVDRTNFLGEGRYFKCGCLRCLDPTELNTEISSLVCPRCRKGLIRPSLYQCDHCKRGFSQSMIQTTISECDRRMNALDFRDAAALERFLKKLSLTFHCKHYMILQIKQELVRLYTGPSITDKKRLLRKVDLCSELLEVFKKIEPGISRIQAIALYELHSGLVNLAQKEFNSRDIKEDEFVERLKVAENLLKDALKYLLYEPPKSPEGKLAQNALSELKMLRLSITNLQRSLLEQPQITGKRHKKGKNKSRM